MNLPLNVAVVGCGMLARQQHIPNIIASDRMILHTCCDLDEDALAAFESLSRLEGIIPAFESSHALAFAQAAVRLGALPEGARVLLNLSGRGQKDLDTWARIVVERENGS